MATFSQTPEWAVTGAASNGTSDGWANSDVGAKRSVREQAFAKSTLASFLPNCSQMGDSVAANGARIENPQTNIGKVAYWGRGNGTKLAYADI